MRAKLKNLFYRLVLKLVKRRDARDPSNTNFPNSRGVNYLFEPLFDEGPDGAYFTCLNMEAEENPLAINFNRYKYEVLKGNRRPAGKTHRFTIEEPSAIPYAVTGVDITRHRGEYSVQFSCNGKRHEFRRLMAERFYYLPVREPADVEFLCDHDLIIGKPIPLTQTPKNPCRLALMIFVDSFTWEIFDRLSFDKDLPNLSRFFSKGTVFENAYSASNWTVPSIASVYSGKTPKKHGMFHPRQDIVLGKDYPVISELFQREGYLTFQACGNHRKTPSYGYAKGFDRMIYRYMATMSDLTEAVFSQLRAFPKRDHFIWLSIFDAHTPIALTHDISIQMALPLDAQDYHQQDAKTPMQLEPNPARTLRYMEELKRIDFSLGRLFDFIESRYGDDEIMVCLLADHGPSFTTPDQKMLSREKTHIALMMRGRDIPSGNCDELVHQTDVLPSMLRSCGIGLNSEIDGRLPERLGGEAARDHVISEILYPGTTRKLSIRDQAFDFYLETEGIVDDDGNFETGDYRMELYRKEDTEREVSAEHPDIVARFRSLALEKLAE